MATLLFLLISTTAPLWSQLTSVVTTVGGDRGWGLPAAMENVAFRQGWRNGAEVVLAHRTTERTDSTDLLLSFDGFDAANSRYQATEVGTVGRAAGRIGGSSAYFDGRAAIWLVPVAPAGARDEIPLVLSNGRTGSFTIDLWINPRRVADGARLIDFEGTLSVGGSPHFQRMSLIVDGRRLVWELDQVVFRGGPGAPRPRATIRLESPRILVPDRWTHHLLEFNAGNGTFTVITDGRSGTIERLDPSETVMLGSQPLRSFTVGGGFAGRIDELRITRGSAPPVEETPFSGEPGVIVTAPIPLAGGARLEAIEYRAELPGRTAVRAAYRPAAVRARTDDAPDDGWRPVPADGRIVDQPQLQAVQLRFELLADAARLESPRVQEARIRYRPIPLPPPPRNVDATPIDGGIILTWDAVEAANVAGFRVLFGERPGRYLGTANVSSPIDVGVGTSVRIEGLAADAPYVFAIESYDQFGRSAGLSRELEVRAGGAVR